VSEKWSIFSSNTQYITIMYHGVITLLFNTYCNWLHIAGTCHRMSKISKQNGGKLEKSRLVENKCNFFLQVCVCNTFMNQTEIQPLK